MTIYLYVKECTHCGLKYFGRTISAPKYYIGSGKLWTAHIKKYGRDKVRNLNIWEFTDQTQCTEFALNYSVEHSIVESKLWANLVPENGVQGGGNSGIKYPKQFCEEISNRMLNNKIWIGKKHKEETKLKISEAGRNRLNPVRICDICGKSGKGANMTRYHFKNCKHNHYFPVIER